MPVLLLWKSISFSSAENDEPPIRTVSINCSIVYCRTLRAPAVFDGFLAAIWAMTTCERQPNATNAAMANEIAVFLKDTLSGAVIEFIDFPFVVFCGALAAST